MSSSKEVSKFEKEKQKLVQEKCQGMLNDMLRDDDNKYCVDCDAKGPRWASWNLGIFLCIRCAGIHRNLGVHISRVKSVNLDSWTPEQVVTMEQMGNSRARAVYEANLPDNFRRPQTDVALESFIRGKYEHTKYIAQEWVKPAPVRVDWNCEIEEQIRKKKEKKLDSNVTIPKIGSTTVKKTVVKKVEVEQPPAPPPPTKLSDDLLGLGSTGDDPFASPTKPVATDTEELGALFNTQQQQKMTNQNILSLYGNVSSSQQPFATNNPFNNQQQQPFTQPPQFNQQQPFTQQQGSFNQQPPPFNHFNEFSSFTSAHQQPNISQVQQGMLSLNVGGGLGGFNFPGSSQLVQNPGEKNAASQNVDLLWK